MTRLRTTIFFWNADNIYCGYTYTGSSKNEDDDFYKIEITGWEPVRLDLVYIVHEDAGTIYYPLLLDSTLEEVLLSWNVEKVEDVRVYYVSIELSPGNYYVDVEGYYTSSQTEYILYAYWKKMSEFEGFRVEIGATDFLP